MDLNKSIKFVVQFHVFDLKAMLKINYEFKKQKQTNENMLII